MPSASLGNRRALSRASAPCERRSDSGESGGQPRAYGPHNGDEHDRDQASDQAVFDGGGAGFVASKTGEKIFHGSVLQWVGESAETRFGVTGLGRVLPRVPLAVWLLYRLC